MLGRCSASTANTTRSTSRHCKILLIRRTGEPFSSCDASCCRRAARPVAPLLTLCLSVSPVRCSRRRTKRLLSCLRSWRPLMFRSLLKSIKRYAIHLCCYAGFCSLSWHWYTLSCASFIDYNCEFSLCVIAAQILDTHNKVEEKKKLFLPYNILPLDPESTGQAIMLYPEVLFYHLSC
jgi:hypothetical protein